ncbi:NAD(P)-binding protein [Lindgomyces ingoldianus]|uniref:NAD(P)-binding protein n=1 Tax=Lindgomyces ingoldianus TaxID=673940 RepID=A0ACB6Q7E7_9PLEO|nr:NAD(P)-binding protein [Lindgomyces ingoldianus]KAF2462744.1 NAD(P)-binding protein [Lindgomyces ingoldianus]
MDFLKAQFTKILPVTPANLSESTVLITGANAGIGFEAAREILKSKPKRLILAVRNLDRGNAAASDLSKIKDASTEIDVRQLDQSSFASVKAFADGLSGQKVDVAILNAGVWNFKWTPTTNGYESDLQVNVLSPALLSLLLLPNLRQATSPSAPDASKPHLSFVSSGLHAMAQFPEHKLPAGQVLEALNDQSKYNGQDRYAATKLIGLVWAKELAKRISSDQVIVNAVNPGFCKTNLMGDASGMMKYMTKCFSICLGRSAQDGARCVVDAAIAKGPESHGRYLSEKMIKDEAPIANDAEIQTKIWDEITAILKKEKVFPGSAESL